MEPGAPWGYAPVMGNWSIVAAVVVLGCGSKKAEPAKPLDAAVATAPTPDAIVLTRELVRDLIKVQGGDAEIDGRDLVMGSAGCDYGYLDATVRLMAKDRINLVGLFDRVRCASNDTYVEPFVP